MKLSIVTTLYRSSLYVDEFYERISIEAKKITDAYEIIFVDDGSPDDSLQKAIALCEKDSKVKAIELSRNFGHHKAIMTGLLHAQGEFVFLIDSDLEEEPELLSRFWDELQNGNDIDVVYGVQKSRKGSWFERWSGKLFYKIFNYLSNIDIPKNLLTVRLMTKQANQSIITYEERELCLGCIFFDIGFKQKAIEVNKGNSSETTYSLKSKISLLINSIVSFSNKPLKIVFSIGFIVTFLSFLYILNIIFSKYFYGIQVDGWASVIASIWFFGGLIIMTLGVIGVYISKIFSEVKLRPYTVVKKIYEEKETDDK